MNASILTIGNEILIGQIVDTNSAWLGSQLELLGIKIQEIRSVSDRKEAIVSGISDLSKHSKIIVMTGGLGPTQDDITKKAIADYLGVPMRFSQETFESISQFFNKRNIPIKESHKQQSYLPEGTQILKNELGTAPGMWIEKEGKILISMPGVPHEMKGIFSEGFKEKITESFELGNIYHKTIMTAGLPESFIEEKVQPIINKFPESFSIAFLPNLGTVRIRISGKSNDDKDISSKVNAYADQMVEILGDAVYGFDEISLPNAVQNLFIEKNKKLAVTESCTGGAMAKKITSVSGCSQYFEGSIVAYSYEVKMRILNVSKDTLAEQGAVSELVVKQMLSGVIKQMNVDVGMAISGIMGPTGGTEDKPVGTVWLAYGSSDQMITKKLLLGKDRVNNIEYCVNYALNALRKFLMKQ